LLNDRRKCATNGWTFSKVTQGWRDKVRVIEHRCVDFGVGVCACVSVS
jgi:hypothetical protein